MAAFKLKAFLFGILLIITNFCINICAAMGRFIITELLSLVMSLAKICPDENTRIAIEDNQFLSELLILAEDTPYQSRFLPAKQKKRITPALHDALARRVFSAPLFEGQLKPQYHALLDKTKTPIFDLPVEILFIILEQCDLSTSDLLAWSLSCKYAATTIRLPPFTTLDLKIWEFTIHRDWYLKSLDDTKREALQAEKGNLLCSQCWKAHPKTAFSSRHLYLPPWNRVCRGWEGKVWLCSHRRLSFDRLQRVLRALSNSPRWPRYHEPWPDDLPHRPFFRCLTIDGEKVCGSVNKEFSEGQFAPNLSYTELAIEQELALFVPKDDCNEPPEPVS